MIKLTLKTQIWLCVIGCVICFPLEIIFGATVIDEIIYDFMTFSRFMWTSVGLMTSSLLLIIVARKLEYCNARVKQGFKY